MARFEVCGQKWADLSEPGYGVALLNDCKYGYDIHNNVMRLSLLRAPISPDPKADRGRHQFTYSLLPHSGDFREAGVIQQAYSLNVPLLVRQVAPQPGTLGPEHSFFSTDRQGVIIESIKNAEDGNGLILRLYEAWGSRGSVKVSTTLPVKTVYRTDLLERPIEAVQCAGNAVRCDLKPFEISTLRFTC
jgi:alpha-mannosidase